MNEGGPAFPIAYRAVAAVRYHEDNGKMNARLVDIVENILPDSLVTEPVDFDHAKAAVSSLYSYFNLKPPTFYPVASPLAALDLDLFPKVWSVSTLRDKMRGEFLKISVPDWITISDFGMVRKAALFSEDLLPRTVNLVVRNYRSNFRLGRGRWVGNQLLWAVAAVTYYLHTYEHIPLPLQLYLEAAKACNWKLMDNTVCVLFDRPTVLHLDTESRLHNLNGPAVEFCDGAEGYAFWEVPVPGVWASTPAEHLATRKLAEIRNAEMRRVYLRKMGVEKLTEWAVVLDREGSYRLIDLGNQIFGADHRPARYLQMINPSTGETHVEGVSNECRTVQDALNWRATGRIDVEWNPKILT